MNNLGTLIKFEWKKLFRKKLVKAAILVVIFLQVLSNLSFLMQFYAVYITDEQGNTTEISSRSGYEKMLDDKEDAWALDGRKVDDAMLEEMREFYSAYAPRDRYSMVHSIVGDMADDEAGDFTAEKMYANWKTNMNSSLGGFFLSDGEMEYWEERIKKIETPFTYHYAFAWENMLNNQCLGTAMLAVTLLAVCLAGMFAEESRLKTDHLILCARNGKNPAYLAKVIVGSLFGAVSVLVLYGITFGFHFYFYGTDGFGAILQQNIVYSPYPISVGQAVLIMFFVTLLMGILESVFAMVLSLTLNNNLAAMAVVVGLMMLTFVVHVPKRFRVLSYVWHFIPLGTVGTGEFFDGRLLHLFGIRLTNFEAVLLLYPLVTVLFALMGKRKYNSCPS